MVNRTLWIKASTSLGLLIAFLLVSKPAAVEPVVVETRIANYPAEQAYFDKLATLQQQIIDQEVMDQMLLDELKLGTYTVDEPLVVVNPYGNSPLTAYILFETEIPMRITVEMVGRTADVSFFYEYTDYQTQHMIPIYALYAGEDNLVNLHWVDALNNRDTKSHIITTDPLPDRLEENILKLVLKEEGMQSGLSFTYHNGNFNGWKTAFDANGDTRWYLMEDLNLVANYQSNYLWSSFEFSMEHSILIQFDYMGRILSVYEYPYEIHHDISLDQDTLLITSSDNYPNTVADFVVRFDPLTGDIVQTIEYRSILFRSRVLGLNYSVIDWMHMNSVEAIEDDLIISSNYQSSIVRNSWSGEIEWILGDPQGYPQTMSDLFLEPISTDFIYPYNQHAAEVLMDLDGDENTLDLLVFDNGSSRNVVDLELQRQILALETLEPPLYSRLVHYRIDEKNKTVEEVWSYGTDRPELFSAFRGDVDLLENQNYLAVFNREVWLDDVSMHGSTYLEVDASGEVVWELWASSSNAFNTYQDYQVERINLMNDDAMTIDLAYKVNNFIKEGTE